jgi:hypothetical protein
MRIWGQVVVPNTYDDILGGLSDVVLTKSCIISDSSRVLLLITL